MARTLEDVAKVSGVSRATVSRVINGGPVSEETRRKVIEAIEGTNYRPNLAARGLVTGRTGVVGVVLHVDPWVLFQDPYFSNLLHGIADALAEEQKGMMLWLGSRTKEETLDQILGMGLLDGVIVTADLFEDPLVDGLVASTLPTVLVGHRRSDGDASYVDIDQAAAATMVVEHLVSLGRTRIGHVTGRRGTPAAEDRLTGYLDAMAAAGLPTDGLVVDGEYTEPSGEAAVERLVAADVDAVFAANDASARGVMAGLRRLGNVIPDDVALVGFDDLPFAADLDPPLTTVRQGVGFHGFEAARLLKSLLDRPDDGSRRVLLPTELVVRGSTVPASGPTEES